MLDLEEQDFTAAKQSLLRHLDKSVQSSLHDTDFSGDISAAVSYEKAYPGESDRQVNEIFQRQFDASEGFDDRCLEDE